jgi:hypothetical protein
MDMPASARSSFTSSRLTLAEPTLGSVGYIAKHMRDHDRREAEAVLHDPSPAAIAWHACNSGSLVRVLHTDRPVFVLGVTERWPRVWTAWMFATEEFPTVAKAATRYVRSALLPALRNLGMVRADAQSLADNVSAHAWMKLTGAVFDVDLKAWGSQGEDFVQYRWQ